jgi:hypothetical protein
MLTQRDTHLVFAQKGGVSGGGDGGSGNGDGDSGHGDADTTELD